jgi:hypothetical protein
LPRRLEAKFVQDRPVARAGLGESHARKTRAESISCSAASSSFSQRVGKVAKAAADLLANTYQEDANALAAWYSGWYNGLAHKHYADFKRGKVVEHQLIEYCKPHPDQKIIHAIAVILKEDRAEGLMMEK